MTRGPDESVPIALSYGHYYPSGMCLNFVWTCIESPVSHGLPDANAAWAGAENIHTDRDPPAGAPVYWGGGQHGHIALSLGDGKVRSTDWPGKEQVGTVSIDQITSAWGIPYRGWSTDYDGTPIPGLNGDDDLPTVKDVWNTDGIIPSPNPDDENEFWAPSSYLQNTYKRVPSVNNIWNSDGIIASPDEGDPNTHWAPSSYLRNTYINAKETNDRVMGMLRQKYYVMEGGVAKEVPKGTAGAIATDVLDAIDGNSIIRTIQGLEPTLAKILTAVEAPPPPGPTREQLTGFAALIGALGVVLGAALALAIVALAG